MTRRRSDTTVLVLAGGDSAEREVSLDSGRGIADALRENGYRVLVADPARPDIRPTEDLTHVFDGAAIHETPPELADDLYPARAEFARILSGYQAYGVDVVFNALHGGVGEDGTIQAVMDYLGIRYTGSRAAACVVAMDKQRSKHLVGAAGVPVAPGILLHRSALAAGTVEQTVRETVGVPCVVKPNSQGSSVGLTVVTSFAELEPAAAAAFRLDEAVLVERYIAGREITQAYLEGADGIPVLEIRPESGLYDYFHKYQHGSSEYIVPAPLDPEVTAAVQESARRAVHALGLTVYARIDLRLGEDGTHVFLEANTLPGMTSTSLVPKSVKVVGIDYPELVDRILRLSLR